MIQGEEKTGGLGTVSESATEAQKQVATAFGKRTGLKIEIIKDTGSEGSTASYRKGVIQISPHAGNFNAAMSHELTHFIQDYSPDMYQLYRDTAVNAIAKAEGIDFEAIVNRKIAAYEENGQTINRDQAVDEIVADATEKFLNDPDYIDEVINTNRTLGEKILDFINDVIDALKSLMQTGSKRIEAQALEQNLEIYERARNYWAIGLEEASDRYQAGWEIADSSAKYQLIGKNEDGFEVYEASDQIKEMTQKEKKAALIETIKKTYDGKTARFEKNGVTYQAELDRKGLRKGIYGDKKSDRSGYDAKLNIGADGGYFNLIENASYKRSGDEKGKTTSNQAHKDVDSWDYYGKTIVSDGAQYDVLINIRDTGEKQYVYDVTLRATKKQDPQAARPKSAYGQENPVTNTISEAEEKSNTRFQPEEQTQANENQNNKENVRFQLKNPVEETKNLIAVHNLNEQKLLKTFELEGIPMPSIAIVKSDIGHEGFGDISLLFAKDTINPKKTKNKVYSADAWTPTFPSVEYETNSEIERNITEKAIKANLPEMYNQRLHVIARSLEDYLQTQGSEAGVIDYLRNDTAMKALYLADQGEQITEITKEIKEEKRRNQKYDIILDIVEESPEQLKKIPLKELYEKYADKIKERLIKNGVEKEKAEQITAKKGLFGFGKTMERVIRYANKPDIEVKQ